VGFEWDFDKARANLRKRGVDFADAEGHLLVAVYAWRGDAIRIISAREATPRERKQYEGWAMRKEYDFSRGRRGAVVKAPTGKTRITIRLDDDVLAWFKSQVHKAGGGNYQTLINRALREHMRSGDQPLEETLRRVLREELPVYRTKRRR
jgi:uncharacterized DUF497 family protein